MELARLFSRIYKSSKTQPPVNLVFLLSGGGKFNYFGTKKWLENHLDSTSSSELLSDVKFCLCLDTIGSVHSSAQTSSDEENEKKSNPNSRQLNMHVSKPPKEDSHSGRFFNSLQAMSQEFNKGVEENETVQIRFVHKKINLADERLAWEHERFSIRRLPAFTLSNVDSHDSIDRISTILDKIVDTDVIGKSKFNITEDKWRQMKWHVHYLFTF